MSEAKLVRRKGGLVPKGEGWFILNAKQARWGHSEEFDSYVTFEGDVHFPEVGFNISVLPPGRPSAMYHEENAQEGFLVLKGECLLIVEGEERRMKAWDFFHCPAGTEHIFVGAGKAPCVIVGFGARKKGKKLRYPRNETALKHGAGVPRETNNPRTAYKPFKAPKPGPAPKALK